MKHYSHRKLIINYRCSKSIVNLANESIKHNKNQLEKKMISNNQNEIKPKYQIIIRPITKIKSQIWVGITAVATSFEEIYALR